MIAGKLESCPDCGCTDGQAWDGRRCEACGHGEPRARSPFVCSAILPAPSMVAAAAFLADKVNPAVLVETALREANAARTHLDRVTALLEAANTRLREGAR